MIHETPILKSKLCFPDRSKSIQRSIEQALAKSILKKRLTTITAGPGYGKTTLVAQALMRVKARIVWLRLDKADSNLVTFLTCLVRGIQKVIPEFSPPDPEDRQGRLPDHTPDETHFRQLLAELEAHLDQDLVLVLDECHWVQGSDAVHAALTFLLQQASSAFHMVLISRTSISLPFSRLKAQRQVLEISSTDLAFSHEEAALLFKACFQAGWDSDLIERIWELTQGWVSGLTLFHYAFHNHSMDDIRNYLAHPDPLPPAIADYLEEEVFSPLAFEIKNFLVRTSILPRLQANFCDEFLEINDSQSMLRHLSSFDMFIHPGSQDKGGYVYHRLFGLFLQKKLLALSSTEIVAGLHRKAAGLYQGYGRIENALEHFLAAADYKEVAFLLNTDGRRLFQEGKYEVLKTCLDTLPEAYIDDLPWVLCLYGKVQGVCGLPAKATQAYDRALAKFTQQDEPEGICLCRIETALNHYFAGQFTEAAQGLEDLLARPAISDELRIEALGYLIFMTTQFRHKDSWHRYYETCRSALAYLDSATLSSRQNIWLDIYRGHAYLATEDNEKALEIGRSIEWRVRQQKGPDDFYGHYVLAASACNALDRYSEGMAYARKGLTGLAQKKSKLGCSVPAWQPARLTPAGIRDRGRQDTTLPFMLLQAARSAFGLGKSEEAIAYARQSTDLFGAMGVRWGQALGMNALCTAYARNGDLVLAEQSALSGLSLLEGLDLPRTTGTLAGNLAAILMMGERYEEALPLIQMSKTAFAPFGMDHWADLWLAMYQWHQDEEKGRTQFLSVLTAQAKRKNFSFALERHWIVPYLVDLYARGHLRDYIFNTLKIIGSDAILDLKQLLRRTRNAALKRAASELLWNLPSPDPPGMKIFLLGRFRVFLGDREIRAGKWGNQKVRSLFQYLACSRVRGYVNRDVLIEMLWPDQDPGKTLNRFHVTMTALRRVLEPDLPDGAPSAYISRVGDTYRIRLGREGSVDLEIFTDETSRAEGEEDPYQAYCHSMKAVSVYEGDLLAEAPFCEWCSQTRQNLQNRYLHALETIIAYYKKQEEFENCIIYAEKYLYTDRTAEKVYRNLMGFYAGTGNLPQVASTLNRCREALHRELDLPVEPETEALARRLLSREQSDPPP